MISDADYEKLSELRYVLRRFINFSTAAAAREGLPSQQHQALLLIKAAREKDGVTVGHLAERLLVAPHSAAELVNRLTAAGYVERNPDPADRRRQLLLLTRKAEAVLTRLSEVHLQEIRDLAPALITLLEKLQRKAPVERSASSKALSATLTSSQPDFGPGPPEDPSAR